MPTIEKNDGAQNGNKKETDFSNAAKQMTDQDIPPESLVRLKAVCSPITDLHNHNSHEAQRIILGRANVSRSSHQSLVEGAPISLRTCHLRGNPAPKKDFACGLLYHEFFPARRARAYLGTRRRIKLWSHGFAPAKRS